MNNEFGIGEQPNTFKIYYNEKDKTYIIAQLIDISYNEREYYTFISDVFPSACKQYGICEDCKFQSSCYKSNKFTDIQNCIKYNNYKDKIMETENKLSSKDILNNAKKEMNNKYKEMNNEPLIKDSNKSYWHHYNEKPNWNSSILIFNSETQTWKKVDKYLENVLFSVNERWIYSNDILKLTNYSIPKNRTIPLYYIEITKYTNKEATTLIKQLYNFDNNIRFIININSIDGEVNLDTGIMHIAEIIVRDNNIEKNRKNINETVIKAFINSSLLND